MIPGGHVTLRFSEPDRLVTASHAFACATRNDDALTLQVPGDGGSQSLRAVLDRLAAAAVEADELTVHTPDLDDVFLSLTGRPQPDAELIR